MRITLCPITLLAFACSSHIANGFSLEAKANAATRSSLFQNKVQQQKSKSYHVPARTQLMDLRASPALSPLHLSGGANEDTKSQKTSLSRELIAEFIGTFMIVQIGCGTVCAAIFNSAQVGLWQIAAVWSIAVTLAISCTAAISGAHLNPAITLAFAAVRDFEWKKVIPFMFAQLIGAVAAGGVNFALFRDNIVGFEKANDIVRGAGNSVQSASAFGEYWSVSNWGTAFLAEAYGTAMLAFVIFALTNDNNETTSKHPFLIPPLIGATVAALISVIAPLTQAGFNPARDFGPRIIALWAGWGSVAMKGWWVYVAAPLVGAPVGAWIADKILYPNK